jgi:putative ABC transport system ATP-binding protein
VIAMPAAVSLVEVSHEYRSGRELVPALQGVSLEVEAGEFVALCGPSGSGKTTLLNVAGCLEPPTSGAVRLMGHLIAPLSDSRRARLRNRCVGFVFQRGNLIPVLTAYENVEYPLVLQGMGRRERRARVDAMLADIGLGALAARRPAALSAGQRARVAVARGLVTNPPIVLADEPTANLDSATGEDVVRLLTRMSRDHGTSVILATHDAALLRHADVVYAIRDGRVTPRDAWRPSSASA